MYLNKYITSKYNLYGFIQVGLIFFHYFNVISFLNDVYLILQYIYQYRKKYEDIKNKK